ncbi:hypothetical protein PARPLA_00867 [Rhodobacteraceae bacterium THAF1]|uniref:hypothetical protein n=1 Tax=Palleronia sp. THAF1 TaxID=2587842 RepID=UPI000F4088FF|nr:hypothetical protein [Palleronia sp. THAF1]QFU09574.1 hypothetical protein FIU81_12920 [Palleronia sp. THAF1]VDC17525.1 hypothetical protein PARPLA_00867 [Rhodobacteraceae bacterium THAF1]
MILRLAAALGLLLSLAGCITPPVSENADLGDFRLGYNIVQANGVKQGPFSRTVTGPELTGAMEQALETRLARYNGDGLYHIGVSIGGYVLAQPGLPLVYTPKSALIFEVNVYDNQTQQRLNAEPKQFTAFEGLENTAPIVGSGIVRGKEEQLANLTRNGAAQVETWLKQNPDWFVAEPGQTRMNISRSELRARSAAAVSSGGGIPAN